PVDELGRRALRGAGPPLRRPLRARLRRRPPHRLEVRLQLPRRRPPDQPPARAEDAGSRGRHGPPRVRLRRVPPRRRLARGRRRRGGPALQRAAPGRRRYRVRTWHVPGLGGRPERRRGHRQARRGLERDRAPALRGARREPARGRGRPARGRGRHDRRPLPSPRARDIDRPPEHGVPAAGAGRSDGMKTSLGIWALGTMATRFVPGGYKPEVAGETTVERVRRAVEGLGDLIDDYEFHYPQELSRENLDEVREALDGHGIYTICTGLHLDPRFGRGGLVSPDPELRAEAVRLTLEAADFAGELGANFVIWPGIEGYNYPFQSPYKESWAWFVDGIGQAAERCRE